MLSTATSAFSHHSLISAICLVLITLLSFASAQRYYDPGRPIPRYTQAQLDRSEKTTMVLCAIVGPLMVLAILFHYVPIGYAWFLRHRSNQLVFAGVVAGLLACAYFLYQYKRLNRAWYGLTEVTFGVVCQWNAIDRVLDAPSDWPLSLAAAYVCARGFDNYYGGRADKAGVTPK
jgi:hypothetical protein